MDSSNSTAIPDVTTHVPHNCSGADQTSLNQFREVSWWFSGVGQILICIVGLMANSLSIAVLSSRQMNTIFYRLLICLSGFDSVFLFLALLESIRKDFGGVYQPFHSTAFVYVFYPLQNINLCCCIYMTVALSLERYLAVSKPVEYHQMTNNPSKAPRLVAYCISVVIFSVVFNVPKFFELKLNIFNATNSSTVQVQIAPTELRLMEAYVVYYYTLARGIVTGVIPFVALAILNYLIYMAVRRRRVFLSYTTVNGQHAADENRQALMLCAIVVIFLVSNVPRNFISLYESIHITRIKDDYYKGCPGHKVWILAVNLVSQLLLSINSALNFFLYCIMSPMFRRELGLLIGRMVLSCKTFLDRYVLTSERQQSSSQNTQETIQLSTAIVRTK